ncbi:MAG: hypothetical protein A4E24_01549 [Methanomethylovorans sp. PtaU1.Bin093]|uniref:DUF3006 domain-containing protein n=1 Tax=Methanomethylovorans sp. PtaU1.Bin093 TaxID=1811679 RepID=UPI0009CBCC54|nr:DUF3006 domain-containing protein [Methanomethylovorans sp. PtaU1.Bin093]OPY19737.1 MAG: hypothetical protein A4E24_01549 [Methanomethylovorans sp. PtaU1.Bin093]
MNFKATLDWIENEIAVLLTRPEETTLIQIPLFFLPEGSEEGDILNIDITKDMQETGNAKARASALLYKLKSKN